MRILIVEDDEPSRVYLQRVLERAGYEVRATSDGLAALDVLQAEDIRVVITDWMMPRMGGVELCRRIRERTAPGYVFTIVVTAKDKKDDIVAALDAGADDYLTKPYDKEELLARVRAGWRIVSLEHELSEKNSQLSRAYATMQRNLAAAGRVQRSFLPRRAPQVAGVGLAWFYEPCEMVGGDTFNFFAIDDAHVAMYLLDVSGHGVTAAMLSVTLSRVLIPHPERGGILTRRAGQPRPPKEVARILNARFPMDDETGQYFTLLYGLVHRPSMTLRVVQAGHPYLLRVGKQGEAESIRVPGFPIGMFDDAEFEEVAVQLTRGDRVFLYSDGIVEAENRSGEAYGAERLTATVVGQRDRPLGEVAEGVLGDVRRFAGERPFSDDMTLVALEFAGAPET